MILIVPEAEHPTVKEKCVRFQCSMPKCTSEQKNINVK